MAKKINSQGVYDDFKETIIKRLAKKHRVSSRYIRMIADGDRVDETIFAEFMEAKEGLVRAVEQLVPFN